MQFFYQCQYNDGSKHPETLEKARKGEYEGEGLGYDAIEDERLKFFDLYGVESMELTLDNGEKGAFNRDKHVLRVRFDDDDKRLILFQRRINQAGGGKKIFWFVGWQKTVNGENVQSIHMVFPDGHIQSIGQWQEGLLAEPNL